MKLSNYKWHYAKGMVVVVEVLRVGQSRISFASLSLAVLYCQGMIWYGMVWLMSE